jgi:hypothetical protein
MTDPYRISETSDAMPPAPVRAGVVRRRALWLLLVICAAGNAVTSTTGFPVLVGIGFGLATLACGVALAVDHYRQRRR